MPVNQPSKPDLAKAEQAKADTNPVQPQQAQPKNAVVKEDLHQVLVDNPFLPLDDSLLNKSSKLSGDDWKKFKNYVRLHYPTWFNVATVGLHAAGALLPNMNIVPNNVSKGIKELAIHFSRWGVPISKIHNSYEAFKGKRAFEAVARFAPAALLPTVPFFNFQLPYGLSSGINLILEHIKDEVGGFKKEDGFAKNNSKVFKGLKDMWTKFRHPHTGKTERVKLGLVLGGTSAMLSGSIPALIFARKELNTLPAKLFGSVRSLGGLLGDLSIILFSSKKDPIQKRKEQIIGSFYLIPTIMDFAQRWIDQGSEANEIFNHAKTALNTIAELMWTHFSTEDNVKQEREAQMNQNQNDSLDSESQEQQQIVTLSDKPEEEKEAGTTTVLAA